MTAPDVTTAVERVRRWVGGDLDCYGTGTEAADKFTTDLRTLLSELDRLSAALVEARGWRPIIEHDNSRDPVLVEDKHGRPVVAWRHHPSSRTDEFVTIPGGWSVPYPTRFATIPSRARREARDGRE